MTDLATIERDRQRVMNPLTLERLAANASDLSRTHRLVNVFRVFIEADVGVLCSDLEAAGFALEARGRPLSHGGTRYWTVEARLNMVPALTSVNSMTDCCVGIAVRNKADYDGWYAEVVPTAFNP